MRRALPLLAAFALACSSQVPAQPPVPEGTPGSLPGRVLESISASSYSYLRLQTATGEVWAAVPSTEVAVGSLVTLVNASEMKGFESKTLNRRFDSVLFGYLAGEEITPVARPAVKLEAGEVQTIASVFADRAGLESKPVTVRGQVVKFTPDVLERHWVHLRDGSGSEAAGDHDLTFTTTDVVAVGDTVTATGLVRLKKDFGAGYTYELIVEEASLTK